MTILPFLRRRFRLKKLLISFGINFLATKCEERRGPHPLCDAPFPMPIGTRARQDVHHEAARNTRHASPVFKFIFKSVCVLLPYSLDAREGEQGPVAFHAPTESPRESSCEPSRKQSEESRPGKGHPATSARMQNRLLRTRRNVTLSPRFGLSNRDFQGKPMESRV
jgi:hypothetical protein